MLVETFSNRLKEVIQIRKITPAEIVRRSELLFKEKKINKPLNKPLMTNYLKGNYEAKQENVYSLSLILDVDEAWLMGYDVPMESNINKYNSNTITSEFELSENPIYACPVYGKISAGIPNWAEECIEGRLPIDPILMGIHNPEECYFLRVYGESMNKVVKNGSYALIRKTDWVENGEIAVVLVNGFDATLKKFTKQGDLIVLEPMSDDPTIQTQVYNKDTSIKIIGKYIGKFEIK